MQCYRSHVANEIYKAYCPRKRLSRLAQVLYFRYQYMKYVPITFRIPAYLHGAPRQRWQISVSTLLRTSRICMSSSVNVQFTEAKFSSTRACGHHFRSYSRSTSPDVVFRTNVLHSEHRPGFEEPKIEATCLKSQRCVALSMVQSLVWMLVRI